MTEADVRGEQKCFARETFGTDPSGSGVDQPVVTTIAANQLQALDSAVPSVETSILCAGFRT